MKRVHPGVGDPSEPPAPKATVSRSSGGRGEKMRYRDRQTIETGVARELSGAGDRGVNRDSRTMI